MLIKKIQTRFGEATFMTTTKEETKPKADSSCPAPSEAELRDLGFNAAATKVKEDRELARKCRIAFEHFRYVTPENFRRFAEELKGKTWKNHYVDYSYSYDQLVFTKIAAYNKVPPKEALAKVREAKALGCFDDFEVATVQSVRVVPDPIIFGIIRGDENKYFVAQWDDDVKIEQILREDEG